ncbi:phage shock protein C [Anaerosolibacter carboniphilus]|uniref:Phage shock protein C n=1 Tax=Anaerosolibacter carboniphilus TaxID=1417629 RepID=A0A841L3Y8_9FIRM|nr:PspC domain-containing protein [Anaerosolibacter carboniphilus]MBB6217099.1 phage shock protein C [Anaerosolibacter carboniphilus]
MTKQLYRSKKNRVISGVCGGIAEYLDLDPTLIRLLWVLITVPGGIGFIAYLVSIIIIPENPYHFGIADHAEEQTSMFDGENHSQQEISQKNRTLAGVLLIVLGVVFFSKQFFHWIDIGRLWPLLLIGGGIYIIYKGKGEK